jgi:hypothetical protein
VKKSPVMKPLARLLPLIASIALIAPRSGFGTDVSIYKIELAGGTAVLAKKPPVPQGNRLVFTRYPDGAIVSLKRADVRRVVTTSATSVEAKSVKPGTLVILGSTGGSNSTPSGPSGGGGGGAAAATSPGEGPGGTAMFNPSRNYRPEWDGRQVPGQSLAFPASANDYREGATLAHPPAGAMQSSPGQPPTGVPSGEPPKAPN